MKVHVLPILIAVALCAPLHAAAGGAIADARGAADNPAAFDGGRSRPENSAVTAGSPGDTRTATQIARDEQIKADARTRANLTAQTPGPDTENAPKKPNPWVNGGLVRSTILGGLTGALIGSLFGLIGLGVGALIGAALYYGLTKMAQSEPA